MIREAGFTHHSRSVKCGFHSTQLTQRKTDTAHSLALDHCVLFLRHLHHASIKYSKALRCMRCFRWKPGLSCSQTKWQSWCPLTKAVLPLISAACEFIILLLFWRLDFRQRASRTFETQMRNTLRVVCSRTTGQVEGCVRWILIRRMHCDDL